MVRWLRRVNMVVLAWCIGVISAAGMLAGNDGVPGGGRVDYQRDVRPILSDKCFRCHGPDAQQRQAGLRLDDPQAALQPAESGRRPIVSGQPDASELVRRIYSGDDAERMPPADSGKSLTDAEKELLRRWIAEGADMSQHWAFVAPKRPPLPQVRNTHWPRNGIDLFVLARLEALGLQPAPEADRNTLIRRVTLDLTGLPPTPDEVDAFLADQRPDAYERLVDRLLQSVHYGERMALDWLDAARYADTHGYHIDAGRDMWPWRQWVIEAFNRNLPFDQFIVEQLAGDLLPNASRDQLIASGFNRNHMINFEGGAIPEEYHTAYVVDRVNTTGAVFLGLTIGCAQCHEHKYDPITQREYYQLYAFFNNVPEKGLDGQKGNAAPFIPVGTPEEEQRLAALRAKEQELQARLQGDWPEVDAEQAHWEADFAGTGADAVWQVVPPEEVTSEGGATAEVLADGSVLFRGNNPARDVHRFRLSTALETIRALRLEALPDASFVQGGTGRSENANFVLTDVSVVAISARQPDQRQRVEWVRAFADYSQKDFDVTRAIDGDPASGWAVDGHLHQQARWAVFVPREPFGFPGGTVLEIQLKYESPYPRHVIGRPRWSLSADGRASLAVPEDVRAALAVPSAKRNGEQRRLIRNFYRENVSTVAAQVRQQLQDVIRERTALEASLPTTMVMQEMPQPRETFLLIRGQYDRRGERVEPDVPGILPPLPPDAPRNRLGLALWLISPQQPLTARVTVNRFWQMFFGTGLVKTSEDFGSQGERPSHPELLDWLAVEFREPSPAPYGSGSRTPWDVKAIIRLIVTSATYRQTSAVGPDCYARDPENRLLSRGPRFRLQAEFVRDQALALSGLLDRRIGGRSVSPYQPPGLWEELASREDSKNWTAQTYVQSHGRDLYRRSMYIFWKRTSPPPAMTTFDAPDRETCALRRSRTNTPLQALVVMNDPTFVEASRKLAERVLLEGGPSTSQRIAYLWKLATAREPTVEEQQILSDLLQQMMVRYERDPEAAAALLQVGESPCHPSLAKSELAAWTIVANAVLNLDQVLTRG
jgi:mono/diheme cytochrome c family protein